MSQAYSGVEGNVLVGAIDVDVSGWTLDLTANTFDSTTTADLGWDDETPATSRVDGTFEFFYNKAKKPTGSLGLRQGSVIDSLTLYVNKTDDEKFQGKALVKKISFKSKTKDGTPVTVTFSNKGPWVLPT